MAEMNKNLRGMAKLKHQLHAKSNDFRRDLVLLLVGRSSVRESDFSHVIDQVVDSQRVMSSIHYEQANADDHIVQISGDYVQMVASAQEVLARRRKVQMDLERESKKARKGQTKMAPDGTDATSEVAITDGKSDLEALESKFESVNQTVRRELEHFDYVMREEFEKAFSAYSATYWTSLDKTKTLDINNTRPNTTAPSAEPMQMLQYEELSAVSYHL